jgi:hypothetical protein
LVFQPIPCLASYYYYYYYYYYDDDSLQATEAEV